MTETSFPYGTSSKNNFKAQYQRVCEGTACATQAELAAILSVRPAFIADVLRRAVIPVWLLARLRVVCGINPDWIKHGRAPQFLGSDTVLMDEINTHEILHYFSSRDLLRELQRRKKDTEYATDAEAGKNDSIWEEVKMRKP